jgi:hypothetical protein
MSNVEQVEKAVTEARAAALRIMRGPQGVERPVGAISAKTFRLGKSLPALNALPPRSPET